MKVLTLILTLTVAFGFEAIKFHNVFFQMISCQGDDACIERVKNSLSPEDKKAYNLLFAEGEEGEETEEDNNEDKAEESEEGLLASEEEEGESGPDFSGWL